MASTFLSPFHGNRAAVLPRPVPSEEEPFCTRPAVASASSGMGSKGSSFYHAQKVLPSWHKISEPHDMHKHYRMLQHTSLLSSASASSNTGCSTASSLWSFVPWFKGLRYLLCFVNFGGVKTAELHLVNVIAIALLPASFMEKNMPLFFILI